jgi:hypothetical protein
VHALSFSLFVLIDPVTDHVLYSPKRFEKLLDEAVKGNTLFGADDRIGITSSTGALAKAGLIPTSTVLTLADRLRNETESECRPFHAPSHADFAAADEVWQMILSRLGEISLVWFENKNVKDRLNAFRRVSAVMEADDLGVDPACSRLLCPWSSVLASSTPKTRIPVSLSFETLLSVSLHRRRTQGKCSQQDMAANSPWGQGRRRASRTV